LFFLRHSSAFTASLTSELPINSHSSLSFVDYTLTFWDWKCSPYIATLREEGVQEKLLPGKTRFQKIRYMLQKRLCPYFKNIPLHTVTAKDINKFLVSLLGSLKVSSLKKISEWLQQTVKFAYKEGLLDTDISPQIHRPKGECAIKPILTIDQSIQLFSTTEQLSYSIIAQETIEQSATIQYAKNLSAR
jgi:hypothetical protein